MGKEFPLKPDQRGQDAGQEVPMRTPRQLYAAERIIYHPELLTCLHCGDLGRTFQCGEGWHSNEKTVRFWIPSPRVPKETDARCYAYTTPYTTMTPLCNVS